MYPQQVCRGRRGWYTRWLSHCSEGPGHTGQWPGNSLMKFHKGKYKVLCLGRNNSRHNYALDVGQLESRSAECEVGFCWDSKLTMSHQCTLMMKKAPSVMRYKECCQQVKGGGQPGEQKAQWGYIFLYIMYVSIYIYMFILYLYIHAFIKVWWTE